MLHERTVFCVASATLAQIFSPLFCTNLFLIFSVKTRHFAICCLENLRTITLSVVMKLLFCFLCIAVIVFN